MNADIGKKIKTLRTKKKLTLKDLSEQTGLSIGFLSQLERGLTTAAIDSLEIICRVLGTELGHFFMTVQRKQGPILRHYERQIIHMDEPHFIHYQLSNNLSDKELLPRLIEILPSHSDEEIISYQHRGEEFIYVLEGILTVYIHNERHDLYPGDTAHYKSIIEHNWANHTNKMVRLLAISTPNHFKSIAE